MEDQTNQSGSDLPIQTVQPSPQVAVVPENPISPAPSQDISFPSDKRPKSLKKIILLVVAIVILVVMGLIIYLVFLGPKLLPIDIPNDYTPAPSPTSEAMIEKDEMSDWETFKGTTIPVSFRHPKELAVLESNNQNQGFGEGVFVSYNYPDNPPRFMHITIVSSEDINQLMALEVGGQHQDEAVEQNVATRLEDQIIGSAQAKLIEWNMQWEIPGPVREYYIPLNQNYIKIRTTYSNLEGLDVDEISPKDAIPMYTFDYVQAFDQILSTFEFTDSETSYVCPESTGVSCKPPIDSQKPECSQDFITWATENCPNFTVAY